MQLVSDNPNLSQIVRAKNFLENTYFFGYFMSGFSKQKTQKIAKSTSIKYKMKSLSKTDSGKKRALKNVDF